MRMLELLCRMAGIIVLVEMGCKEWNKHRTALVREDIRRIPQRRGVSIDDFVKGQVNRRALLKNGFRLHRKSETKHPDRVKWHPTLG